MDLMVESDVSTQSLSEVFSANALEQMQGLEEMSDSEALDEAIMQVLRKKKLHLSSLNQNSSAPTTNATAKAPSAQPPIPSSSSEAKINNHVLNSTSKPMAKPTANTVSAYIGAELYNKRMFPHGCPSFLKAFVKLFRVEKTKTGGQKLKLVDSRFFTNRDGFGFMQRQLPKGDYQIHFKKYSNGFEVFDFTLRVLSQRPVKLIDDEESTSKKAEKTPETKQEVAKVDKESQKPSEKSEKAVTKNETVNANAAELKNSTQQSLVESKSSQKLSQAVLEQKLEKAIALANNPANDKFFEVKQ